MLIQARLLVSTLMDLDVAQCDDSEVASCLRRWMNTPSEVCVQVYFRGVTDHTCFLAQIPSMGSSASLLLLQDALAPRTLDLAGLARALTAPEGTNA